MSMDYWLQAFENGEEGLFPLSVVETAFGAAITAKKFVGAERTNKRGVVLKLNYPGEPEFDISLRVTDDASPLTSGFGFVHAPVCDAFWQSLLDIMKITATALYWAETENALVIGQQQTRAHLPADMIETLGEPRVVSSFEQLWQP